MLKRALSQQEIDDYFLNPGKTEHADRGNRGRSV